MPQKIICNNCKKILYEEPELKFPQEVIQELNGSCPHCGKKLMFSSERVEISLKS